MPNSSPPGFGFDELKAVLQEAGEAIRVLYGRDPEVSWKKGGDPLTLADLRANALLKKSLSKLLPEAAWLSEETLDDPARLTAPSVWIVDPLDGTKEFLRGIPELAVSVGLVRDGRAVAGGVLNPISGEGGIAVEGRSPRFWGFSGSARPPASRLAQAVACVSRTEMEKGSLPALPGGLRAVGSAAYKLLRVAAGAEDFTYSLEGKSEWDICGGVGLLEATGMSYARLDGNPLRFNQASIRIPCGAVAGPPGLIREFLASARPTSGN